MFSFAITPLGNLFFGLTTLVFVSLIFVKNKDRSVFLCSLLFISLGGLFYAADLITLFVGWEIMGWSSYFIIAKTADPQTLQKYIVFNLGSAFALLGAIILIYGACGSFDYNHIDFSTLSRNQVTVITLLLLITIFVKSGIMPLHYWIVDSYDNAGNIFSAVLSAIISKAGIFVFVLMFFQIITVKYLQQSIFDVVAWLGVVTSIIATFKAISQDSAKRLLAYSSIAQLGYIVTILSVMGGLSLEAALYHTIIHTFVKLLLFVNIAAIIYISQNTKFSGLGGLIYKYPLNFMLLVIGIIALAGMPPLGGFSSKFFIYTALLEEHKGVLLAAVLFSSASAFLYCYKLVYGIYLGQPTHEHTDVYPNIPVSFYIPQIIGALILIILGTTPGVVIPMFNTIVSSVGFEPIEYKGLFEIGTSFASFNGAAIMGVFVIVFVLILLFFTGLKNRSTKPRDRLDISYCGETPRADVNLHYGYGMGNELSRIGFVRPILGNSSHAFWRQVSKFFEDISKAAQRLFTISAQNMGLIIILFFTILLYIGVK
jgi:NADH-quinone oxidoreductase subunit M